MKALICLSLASILLSLSAFIQQPKEWVVPESAKKAVNPTDKSDPENKAIGKRLYTTYCQSCHGKEGYGDGPKVAELKTKAGDFSSVEFQRQTDAAIFYKLTIGRGDMPAFDKKIPDDEDRWLIVNYIRTLNQ